MDDALYKKFLDRWQEITDLPPQTLGPFTPLYKKITGKLKVQPWPALLAVSLVLVSVIYFMLGSTLVFITSLLQRGF